MTDRDALIRAICTDPADDTPRLVFADWLDENGEGAFAKFIRSGIAHPARVFATGPQHIVRRTEDVFSWLWCPRIPDTGVVFRRGFVDKIRLPLAVFLEHAEMLFRQHPITKVVLPDREPWRVSSRRVPQRWTWGADYGPDGEYLTAPANRLPPVLFEAAPYLLDSFDTVNAACAALSAACVVYGRELADLPALEVVRV